MKTYRMLKTALTALRRNVLRAALTMLGIVIGVAAVIAMMEIGNGSSLAIQRTIASMGANNLLIMPGTASSGRGHLRRRKRHDADAGGCRRDSEGSPRGRQRGRRSSGRAPRSCTATATGCRCTSTGPRRRSCRCATGPTWPKAKPSPTAMSATPAPSACSARPSCASCFSGQSPVGKEVRVQNVNVQGHRGAAAEGCEHDGHGPGRHPADARGRRSSFAWSARR